MSQSEQAAGHAAAAIHDYLGRNPRACATIEAIARFWLPKTSQATLTRALDLLITLGHVERRIIAGAEHYRATLDLAKGTQPPALAKIKLVAKPVLATRSENKDKRKNNES